MTLLTPDAYMDLLVERRDAYEVEHPRVQPWLIALPEWFIKDGDEALVDMAAIESANAPVTSPKAASKPRTYRTAASLREERDRAVAKRDAHARIGRHDTTDRAALTGIGIRQTARQQRKYGAGMDRALSEYTRMDARVRDLDGRIMRAEKREGLR